MQHELTEASARLTIKHYLRTLFLISHLDSRADCTSVDATSEGEGVDPVSSGQSISRPGAEPRLLALLALVESLHDGGGGTEAPEAVQCALEHRIARTDYSGSLDPVSPG